MTVCMRLRYIKEAIGVCILAGLLLFLSSLYAQEAPASRLYSEESSAIVVIGARTKKTSAFGSGFVVDSQGLILTNYHIIAKASYLGVKIKSGQEYNNVYIINYDPVKDIALIKIDAKGLRAVKLGDSDKVKVGEKAIAIGNPLGLENSVSDGLISAIRQTNEGFKVFQISVPLSAGSSGGPLFNLKGEVIGITTASYTQGQNVNFALPINYAKKFLGKADSAVSAPAQSAGYIDYVIKPKDTLYGIAGRFNTTVAEITRLNNLKSSKIYVNQRLKVPQQ